MILLELPYDIVFSLLREPGGAFALRMEKGGENLTINYWPIYQHGSWVVQDVSGPNGEATVIRGLSVRRMIGYLQDDADRHSVVLDADRLEEALGRENMERVSALCDVLLS